MWQMMMGAAGGLMQSGGQVASAVIAERGQSQALKAQSRAINFQKYLDPTELRDVSRQQDIEQYASQYNVQRQYDPVMAAIRDAAVGGMQKGLADIEAGTGAAGKSVKLAMDAANLAEQQVNDPEMQKLSASLVARANEDMALGSQLSPEFQAELVRSGLERGSQSGFMPGAEIMGRNVRQMLGQGGEQLRQSRLQGALAAGSGAAGLRAAQTGQGTNVSGFLNNLMNSQQQQQLAGLQSAESLKPTIGMGGEDLANIMVQNIRDYNSRMLAQGNISAARSLAKANMWGSIQGAESSAISNMMSGATGGMGGMGG